MKKQLVGIGAVLVLSLGLGACSSDSANAPKEAGKVTAEQEKKANQEAEKAKKAEAEKKAEADKRAAEEQAKKEAAEAKAKAEEKKQEAAAQQRVKEETALQLLKDNFKGSMSIEFDREHKMYKMTSTDPQFAIELAQILAGQRNKSEWAYVVESMSGLSKTMKDTLGSGYALAITNPVNTDNTILLIMDGVVVYDAVNE